VDGKYLPHGSKWWWHTVLSWENTQRNGWPIFWKYTVHLILVSRINDKKCNPGRALLHRQVKHIRKLTTPVEFCAERNQASFNHRCCSIPCSWKRNWLQYVKEMSCNILLKITKNYRPNGRTNQGRPLKKFLDVWHWNRSTSSPTAGQPDDNDDEVYYNVMNICKNICGHTYSLISSVPVDRACIM
jgi:hypothetical protein